MALTEAQARQRVITEARKHVGYNPGKTYSKFGAWYGWPNALWCAAFASYCFYTALGDTAARLVIGHESTAPYTRGYIWTVAFRQWLQRHGTKVPLRDARPGDVMFFKYPTADDRNANAVNHVDLVEANHAGAGYITTIGGNTPRPGTPGDPSNGRGCWRHNRALTDRYIVDVYRPRWSALVVEDPVDVIQDLAAEVIEALELLDYAGDVAGVRAFQRAHGLTVDGIVGNITGTRLEQEMSKALDKAVAQVVQQVNAHTTQRTAMTMNPITARETGSSKAGEKLSLDEALDLTLRRAAQAFNTADACRDVLTKVGESDGDELVNELLDTELEFAPHTAAGKMWPNGITVRQAITYGAFAVKDYEQNGHPNPIPPTNGPHEVQV